MFRGRTLLAMCGLSSAVMLTTVAHGHARGTASTDFEGSVSAHGLSFVSNMPMGGQSAASGRRDQLGDIAFWGDTAVMFDGQLGPVSGFRVLDVSDPVDPKVLSTVNRKGNTTHIAIWRHLVIISVDDYSAGYSDPGRIGNAAAGTCREEEGDTQFVGLMVYSIEDPSHPECLGQVDTGPGTAHTFTLLPDREKNRLLAYVVKAPGHGEAQTIDLVEIPLNDPGDIAELGPVSIAPLEGNHDMTVFAPQKRAVVLDPVHGLLLWDLNNPEQPKIIGVVRTNAHASANGNNNHSAAFSWDGRYLVVGEEPGSSFAAPPMGGDGEVPIGRLRFYSVQQIMDDYNGMRRLTGGSDLPFLGDFSVTPPVSTYTIAAERGEGESPFMPHQFNMLPVRPDRETGTPPERIVSIGWMRGGTSLIDFTDVREPMEVGHWVALGAGDSSGHAHSNNYASMWYRDHIYATNVAEDGLLQQYLSSHLHTLVPESSRPSRGLDVLALDPNARYKWAHRVAHLPRLNYSLQENHGSPNVQQIVTGTKSSGTPVLQAVIRNTGYAITPATRMIFALDGRALGEARAPALSPGHTATVTVPWTPPTDTNRHSLTVFPESHTADGVRTFEVAVYGDQVDD